jgi:hypothetical protein
MKFACPKCGCVLDVANPHSDDYPAPIWLVWCSLCLDMAIDSTTKVGRTGVGATLDSALADFHKKQQEWEL